MQAAKVPVLLCLAKCSHSRIALKKLDITLFSSKHEFLWSHRPVWSQNWWKFSMYLSPSQWKQETKDQWFSTTAVSLISTVAIMLRHTDRHLHRVEFFDNWMAWETSRLPCDSILMFTATSLVHVRFILLVARLLS